MQEAVDGEVTLQGHLDIALTRVEELEEDLKTLRILKNEVIARPMIELQMELEGIYRARLERVSQASRRDNYKEAWGASSSS